jgi:uncharacterized protein (TIGR02265 family)
MASAFVAPDWDAPLDAAAYIEASPPGASIKGMFATAVAEGARTRRITLPSARARYLAFQDVPLREYMTLLVEAARAFFPQATLRQSLRKLGRSSRDIFAQSIVGRVVLSTAEDLPGALVACAKAYAISTPPARAEVREMTQSRAVVTFSDVYHFLDSHHVGVLEGIARGCGVRVDARVRLDSPYQGDIELTW